MIRKVKLSRNLFILCFIIITITYRLVNLTQHQNNYTIQWTLPKKLMNSPNVTITSPMATTYTSMNITVELNGDAVHFWYYITSIDTINRTWFTSENRVITEDGSYTLHAYGNDSLGDITHVSVSFIIDTLPPIITNLRAYDEAGGNILPENNWHKDTDPLFTWDVSPDVTGILGYSTSINSIPDTVVDTTEKSMVLSDLSEGITNFSVRACDNAGHWGPPAQFRFKIDTLGDDVLISSSSHPDEGSWYSNNTITFCWSTSSSTSPIVGYSYILDQLPTTESDATIDISTQSLIFENISEGIWYFHIRAIDQADNIGPVDHYKIMVDYSVPMILNLRCYSEPGGYLMSEIDWYQDTDPFFAWDVTPDVNGILGYSTSINGIPDTTVDTTGQTMALAALPDGVCNFSVRACDTTGNWGPPTHFILQIDTIEEDVLILSSSHPEEGTWYINNTVSFNWSTSSSSSPILGYSYNFDQLLITEPDATVDISTQSLIFESISEGIWYFHLRAIDQAGNVGSPNHYAIRIDYSVPTILNLRCYSEAGGYPILESDWYQDTDLLLIWEVTPDINGVLGYSTSLNGIPDTIVDTTDPKMALVNLPDGINNFSVRACDGIGKWGPISCNLINIDTISDISIITSPTHPIEGTWYQNNVVQFIWTSSSTSPIIGVSYVFDQLATTKPDASIETSDHSFNFTDVNDGIWYLHLRVSDKAGNLGPTAHFSIQINSSMTTTTEGKNAYPTSSEITPINNFLPILFFYLHLKAVFRKRNRTDN